MSVLNTQTQEAELYMNDVWCFYFHDPYDSNWTNNSYKLLGTIGTVQEFWQHQKCIDSHINKAMFFLMRDYVFPCWDDPSNIDGGCLSIKVLKEHVQKFWEDMCVKLLGESLLKPEFRHHWNVLNGISCSPKKHFCIIKIWLKNDTLHMGEFFDLLPGYYGEVLYKSNKENIENDHSKVLVSSVK